jgi:hypothetical protein
MNAKEFEIEFYAAMSAWVSGGKQGPDPRGDWQYRPVGVEDDWWNTNGTGNVATNPSFNCDNEYRWRPNKRTVTINGVELVAPEIEAPSIGSIYHVEDTLNVLSLTWAGVGWDKSVLARGRVFLTKEDAQAMADAQRRQRLGGVK